jgi:RNA polymerase sigma factor (TIGR02999 family)
MPNVTELLSQIEQGDLKAADRLLPLVYDELRRVAQAKLRNERLDHTLQATALVHEAYLRLVDNPTNHLVWDSQAHFFAAAAEAMRRILIESARRKKSQKRGGDFQRVTLGAVEPQDRPREDKLLALDECLDRLEQIDARKAQLVKLRFFAGLTNAEAARVLGMSVATAERSWAFSRSWLQSAMHSE